MTTEREIIEGFWKAFVDGFIFHDLEAAARKAEANFLVALGEMCYVDFFGKLMHGRPGPSRNFKGFVEKYMPQYRGILNELYSEVRSGLVHSYFPENVDVIGRVRVSNGGPAIWKEKQRWRIAVVDFASELKIATDNLKSDLLKGEYAHEFMTVILKDPGLERIPLV